MLGDHLGLTEDEEKVIEGREHEMVSVGPLSLHAEHCVVILHNEMDRGGKLEDSNILPAQRDQA